jgi:hypothetical protein
MNRIASAVLWSSLALSLAACAPSATASPTKSTSSSAVNGKPSAPVTVDAQLGEKTARVTVRFDAPASDVRVDVHGVDGLVVTSEPTLVTGGGYEKGSVATFDVAFTPGAGRSHLVVSVAGSFQGAQRSRVASFAVGTPTDEQRRASSATKTDDGNGERIKVMPAGQQ